MPNVRVDTHDPASFDIGNLGREARVSGVGVSLLFSSERPSAKLIETLLSSGDPDAPSARITHYPDPGQGWLELLSSGLTFDMLGLAPASSAFPPQVNHVYGFDEPLLPAALEGVNLVPGGHIAGGGGMLPIVRTLAGLAANFALHLPVSAVAWHSAGTVMAPAYFARIVMNWLGGGAFPALGLSALASLPDGSIASEGLAVFSGQEFQLEAKQGELPADTVKLAVRVADHIVRLGPLLNSGPIDGAPGLFAEPSQVGSLVWIWRQS